MKCAVQIYMVLGGFHVYKSVFLGWVLGRFNIAVNEEHNCGVLPKPPYLLYNGTTNCLNIFITNIKYHLLFTRSKYFIYMY